MAGRDPGRLRDLLRPWREQRRHEKLLVDVRGAARELSLLRCIHGLRPLMVIVHSILGRPKGRE